MAWPPPRDGVAFPGANPCIRRVTLRVMRIAVVAPVWFAVPPTGYGGIELVVSLLADGLVDAGHDVTLFASGGSTTKAAARSPRTARPR
jgi:hypothetical protein